MPKVLYVDPDGAEHDLDLDIGTTVMEGAVGAGVPGIEATCGGACACATCHVHVDPDWLGRLVPPDDMEEAMLEFAEEKQDNSRLSCQIVISAALDGMIVRIPASRG